MSQFQMPITIIDAMNHINNNEYLLPAFQREFVWKAEQIEKLFDSLMRGYPTSSMLFWKVRGETRTKWKFYKFIDRFVLNANDYSIINEWYNTENSNDFYAVLDGQQRLTAMRIGIYGKYYYHEPRCSWNYTPSSFPERTLYLNLSQRGGEEDDCEYFFSFLKETDTRNQDFYIDSEENIWFRVGAVVPFHRSGEEISDYFNDIDLTRDQRKIINKLNTTIFNESSITYYEEDEQSPDKAVKIFTRINSGGTFLLFPDIVFSLMVSNWRNKDAKTEINNLITAVAHKGFEIDKGYIVKSFLYLYHRSVKTELSSFTKDFCETIEDNWDSIRDSILSLFDLMKSFGLTSFTLTSNNATLPILYYIHHSGNSHDYTNKVAFEAERKEIKTWLYSAILRKTFGATTDSVLQQTRKAFTEDITSAYFNSTPPQFVGNTINENIKNWGSVDDETLESLLLTQKDNCYAFPILSLLYPNLDYKNNNFHKDHLHAEALYGSLSTTDKEKYPFKVYNSILNLQMLDKNENESKGKMDLDSWVSSSCSSGDRAAFLKNHLIPDVSLALSNFDQFIVERKQLLEGKLRELLG